MSRAPVSGSVRAFREPGYVNLQPLEYRRVDNDLNGQDFPLQAPLGPAVRPDGHETAFALVRAREEFTDTAFLRRPLRIYPHGDRWR
ncbi:hypothetical protein GCM10023195_00300 [Actinoallomurus liliacearum]|uniref:Uncharacterized protein n=1 Tax=Actinoallomurus liliacearum TaxID=1080073 RepID=A0ABP8TB13_9ACTN